MILEKLETEPFGSNCYILGAESTKEGLIIDPGADARRILKEIEDLGIKVKLILVTHAHFDHIGALKIVKEATKVEVAMHAVDASFLKTRSTAGTMFHIDLKSLPSPDRLLKDGDIIDIGDLHFTVLHTPGHSPGGICLLGEGVVFTGDTLFNFGIGRYDMPGGNGPQLMESIHTKLMILPDNTVVYPGHGPETTIGAERLWNPFLRG